jgi:hypothetical protein
MTGRLAAHYGVSGRRKSDWIEWGAFFVVGVGLLVVESTRGLGNVLWLIFAASLTGASLIRLVALFSSRRNEVPNNEQDSATSI